MIVNFFNLYCSKYESFGFDLLTVDTFDFSGSLLGCNYDPCTRRLTVSFMFVTVFNHYF